MLLEGPYFWGIVDEWNETEIVKDTALMFVKTDL